MAAASVRLDPSHARGIWMRAQRLLGQPAFGEGAAAVEAAVSHLGYVQIDTINVIERSHHHILHSRIPGYRVADLAQAQSVDKSVFEYWAHALAYLPMDDYRHFVPAMDAYRENPKSYFGPVNDEDYRALLRRIRRDGPLSIRDIDDDVLVDKTHAWGSRKPSKRALTFGFFNGDLTISQREGIVKTYELARRHFGWQRRPPGSKPAQFAQYLLDRALRSQGMASLDSTCYGNLGSKSLVGELIDKAARRKKLVEVHIGEATKTRHWIEPSALEAPVAHEPSRVHILSPFDPLVIQRKRLALFFGYEHRFEAYVPATKRVFGYFALPVLVGDEMVAAIDLKMDRKGGKLRVQKWTWLVKRRAGLKAAVEEAMVPFERFQRGGDY
ncbi:winged helix-turn-helix domain-containing protein [Pinirhizobacter soli]|uniref:winged helix-turn-helix domain-containing protein n=1 Tax=Pinirhizobacter soli TaxID=2786953 RepID=UPI00202A06D9|nr:crosslink repair DNA glycosylase YcaQ family protein [Pinirhizobacter soli]